MTDIGAEGITLSFGKYEGELITRIPVSYLKWMINNKTPQAFYAKAEFERRGDTMPLVEISGHAIDNASLRVQSIWHETSEKGEGLYTWLQRITLEALRTGKPGVGGNHGKIAYLGMRLVIEQGQEFPVLKTIMRK